MLEHNAGFRKKTKGAWPVSQFLDFMQFLYPFIILGLMIDRYYLEPDRTRRWLIDKCAREGRCICGRAMTVVDDE